jgi:hypothetical protein
LLLILGVFSWEHFGVSHYWLVFLIFMTFGSFNKWRQYIFWRLRSQCWKSNSLLCKVNSLFCKVNFFPAKIPKIHQKNLAGKNLFCKEGIEAPKVCKTLMYSQSFLSSFWKRKLIFELEKNYFIHFYSDRYKCSIYYRRLRSHQKHR